MAPQPEFPEIDAGLEAGATDWHLRGGEPICIRVAGRLVRLDRPAPAPERVRSLAQAALESAAPVPPGTDASFPYRGDHFRLHAYSAAGDYCLSLRHIPSRIRSLEELGVPAAFQEAARGSSRGLILVTGQAGSGKSTTLAAALDGRNRRHAEVILTLEDPIEFRHRPVRAVVRQQEKGRDFGDFPQALRGALRADPDVIFVGELRDLETIAAAVTAAETGHLVFGSLHCATAPDAISRILDVFPSDRSADVRAQLARHLVAVLAQERTLGRDGRLATAFELLVATPAARALIADPAGRCALLANEIATGRPHGMISMQQSREDLKRRER